MGLVEVSELDKGGEPIARVEAVDLLRAHTFVERDLIHLREQQALLPVQPLVVGHCGRLVL